MACRYRENNIIIDNVTQLLYVYVYFPIGINVTMVDSKFND